MENTSGSTTDKVDETEGNTYKFKGIVCRNIPCLTFGSLPGLQRTQISIDGWTMEGMSEERIRSILDRGFDFSKSSISKDLILGQIEQCKNLLQVGILDGCETNQVRWYYWYEFAWWLGFDFCRLLGKGSKFRVNTTDWKLNKEDEEDIALWSFAHKKFGINVEKQLKKGHYRNSVNPLKIRIITRWLKSWGWLIRKEDRGNRFVLVSKAWEEFQLLKLFRSKLSELDPVLGNRSNPSVKMMPRIYFIPKVHKNNGINVEGRPIVSYYHVDQEDAKAINSAIEDWISKQRHTFDCKSVVDAINRVEITSYNQVLIVGDVKSLFTSIPRKELMVFIRQEIPRIRKIVENHLASTVFSYGNRLFEWNDGIDMGSRVSPALSRGFLVWKERNFVHKFHEELRYARYLDDVALNISFRPDEPQEVTIKAFMQEYEREIGPTLKMEWQDERNVYMDTRWFKFDLPKISDLISNDYDSDESKSSEINEIEVVQSFNDRNRAFVIEGAVPRKVKFNTILEEQRRRANRFRRKLSSSEANQEGSTSLLKLMTDRQIEDEMKLIGIRKFREECEVKDKFIVDDFQILYPETKQRTDEDPYILSIYFHPFWETPLGRNIIKAYSSEILEVDKLTVRWKMRSRKIMDLLMSKEPRIFVKVKSKRLLTRAVAGLFETV